MEGSHVGFISLGVNVALLTDDRIRYRVFLAFSVRIIM